MSYQLRLPVKVQRRGTIYVARCANEFGCSILGPRAAAKAAAYKCALVLQRKLGVPVRRISLDERARGVYAAAITLRKS